MSPLSLVVENSGLMAFEIPPAIQKTIAAMEEISDVTDATDTSLSTFLSKFHMENNVVKGEYPKARHEQRQQANREYLDVEMEMTNIDVSSFERAIKIQGKAADIICPLIRNRFSSYDQEVFKAKPGLTPKFGITATKLSAKWRSTSSAIYSTCRCQLLALKEEEFFRSGAP